MTGLRPAGPRDAVGNAECGSSFDSPYSAGGLFVNLRTYEGCGADFVAADAAKSGCALYAHHAWRKAPRADAAATEAKAAPTTLGVGVDGGFEAEDAKYDVVKTRSLAVVRDGAVTLVPLPDDAVPDFNFEVWSAKPVLLSGADANRENAWALADEELKESKYAASLVQLSPAEGGRSEPLSPDAASWRCEESGAAENLWLNLSTGYVGGGRDQSAWGGPKGSNGALHHFEATGKKYPLVVKLGTISATGAELYSYAADEDGPVLDAKLAAHLKFWGINALSLEKTEKTTAELEVDANAKFEWSAIAEAGAKLEPLAGVGLLGLVNLGNSCYLNSVAHLLASVPVWNSNLQPDFNVRICDSFDASSSAKDDHLAQCAKLVGALRSRRYAKPAGALRGPDDAPALLGEADATRAEAGKVAPRAFRRLFGLGHAEFATPRQQDAAEYLLHVLDKVEYGPYDPLRAKPTQQLFAFAVEEKTVCGQSGLARYGTSSHLALEVPVPRDLVPEPPAESELKRAKLEGEPPREKPKVALDACLARWAADETIGDFLSSATGARGAATRTARLKTCPRYLLLKVNRYYVSQTWEAKKMDVLVDVPRTLDLSFLRAPAERPSGEGLLPDDDEGPAAAAPAALVPDEAILAQLLSMGFDENGCKRACVATKNAGAEAATEWVFSHMGDPDFALPLDAAPAAGGDAVDPAAVEQLSAMGFTARQAEGALKACDGSTERAADWIFSHMDDLDGAVEAALAAPAGGAPAPPAPGADDMDDGDAVYELKGLVSHIGANTACGHYVAHLRDADGNFVIFDDEKVAKSENPPLMLGYVYLYARK
ncbi:hypothetical protein AURANDRAFT_23104 [Aureococcus anophagefferens]|uniref:Ubiquitin carboxyl-terminal hydrolase n=1 Tax=Aureococcus anophagefferens TaxID=44056 RepID=F0Y4K8_AURAN|nr:hypothetical protein AURANDRAFT_23104 [Aureococcus anophagefferens]EGB10374.1 hypothetical protein AURANDRAFT_23104 [Aureococcus anophagefferens]|eukprot:XP_009035177.1 hypothetical protein AURANDRAFT_23104 [Aureococcus anophagefferens]